jgi:hypothetical protein
MPRLKMMHADKSDCDYCETVVAGVICARVNPQKYPSGLGAKRVCQFVFQYPPQIAYHARPRQILSIAVEGITGEQLRRKPAGENATGQLENLTSRLTLAVRLTKESPSHEHHARIIG